MAFFTVFVAGMQVVAVIVSALMIERSGYIKARRKQLIRLLEKLDLTVRMAGPIFGEGYGCGNHAPLFYEGSYFVASDEALRALNLSYAFVGKNEFETVQNLIKKLNSAVTQVTRNPYAPAAREQFKNEIPDEYDKVRKIIGTAMKGGCEAWLCRKVSKLLH